MIVSLVGAAAAAAAASAAGGRSDSFGRHDVVHLLQLVGEPLLLREFVLLQCDGQLLVVFDSVRVQLVQGAVRVELGGVHLVVRKQSSVFVSIGSEANEHKHENSPATLRPALRSYPDR